MKAGRTMILTVVLVLLGTFAHAAALPDNMIMVDGLDQDNSTSGHSAAMAPAAVGAPVYYRTYGATSFISTHSDLTYASIGMAIYATAIPAGGYSFKKELDLPDGAQITRIDFYVIDNDPSASVSCQLYRLNPNNSSQLPLATGSTSADSAAVQTVTVTGNPIATLDTSLYTCP